MALVTAAVLYFTGVLGNRPSNENPSTGESTGETTEETTVPLEETKPTLPVLTEENSLDLGKLQVCKRLMHTIYE